MIRIKSETRFFRSLNTFVSVWFDLIDGANWCQLFSSTMEFDSKLYSVLSAGEKKAVMACPAFAVSTGIIHWKHTRFTNLLWTSLWLWRNNWSLFLTDSQSGLMFCWPDWFPVYPLFPGVFRKHCSICSGNTSLMYIIGTQSPLTGKIYFPCLYLLLLYFWMTFHSWQLLAIRKDWFRAALPCQEVFLLCHVMEIWSTGLLTIYSCVCF